MLETVRRAQHVDAQALSERGRDLVGREALREADQHIGDDVVGQGADRAVAPQRREHIGRLREGANALGKAGDAHPMVVDLERLTDGADPELVGVEAVDDHAVGIGEGVVDALAGRHRPGRPHRGVRFDADDDDGLAQPVAALPEPELHKIGLRLGHAVDRKRLDSPPLLQRRREILGAHATRGDPQADAGVVDQGRRRVHEIEQHAKLQAHQDGRKRDADERDREANPVVNEPAPSDQRRHAGAPAREGARTLEACGQADALGRRQGLPSIERRDGRATATKPGRAKRALTCRKRGQRLSLPLHRSGRQAADEQLLHGEEERSRPAGS